MLLWKCVPVLEVFLSFSLRMTFPTTGTFILRCTKAVYLFYFVLFFIGFFFQWSSRKKGEALKRESLSPGHCEVMSGEAPFKSISKTFRKPLWVCFHIDTPRPQKKNALFKCWITFFYYIIIFFIYDFCILAWIMAFVWIITLQNHKECLISLKMLSMRLKFPSPCVQTLCQLRI